LHSRHQREVVKRVKLFPGTFSAPFAMVELEMDAAELGLFINSDPESVFANATEAQASKLVVAHGNLLYAILDQCPTQVGRVMCQDSDAESLRVELPVQDVELYCMVIHDLTVGETLSGNDPAAQRRQEWRKVARKWARKTSLGDNDDIPDEINFVG